MFAAHFAVGLAIGAKDRRIPMGAVLAGAFVPDVVWICLARLGAEPTGATDYFDGWSHSCLSVLIEASLFAAFFAYRGLRVWLPVWLAVLSHLVLDAIIHPVPITLYPHASLRVPWDLWQWGAIRSFSGFTHYWWIQLVVVLLALAIYSFVAIRSLRPNLVAATVLIVLGLHLAL